MNWRKNFLLKYILSPLMILLVACAGTNSSATVLDTPTPNTAPQSLSSPTQLPGNLDTVTFIDDDREYTIRQLIPRDGILPIYEPEFVSASESGYNPDELVMGVEINGDSRAYPVGLLRSREMVNDVIGGTPGAHLSS